MNGIIVEIVESLGEYLEKINGKGQNDVEIFYRGQCNYDTPIPGALREEYAGIEDKLYHEIMLRCPGEFIGLSHLDRLVKMQHYGIPTRLLDVTSNPLVALYFACKDYSHKYGDQPGYVYRYSVAKDRIAYSDSDRVLMLSCLPTISDEDRKQIYSIVYDHIQKGKERIGKEDGDRYPQALEKLYNEITKEAPAFKREIKTLDLFYPFLVKPMHTNNRILKQDGAFLISGVCSDVKQANLLFWDELKPQFQIYNRNEILSELDAIGINEASLFPEIDKVAQYLKEKYKARND